MKKSPQICRIREQIACECFAVLYGNNSFQFTEDTDYQGIYIFLGLGIYSDYIETIVLDVFTPACTYEPDGQTRKPQFVPYKCRARCEFTRNPGDFKNLKELYLNLPQGLEKLAERESEAVLIYKQAVPKTVAAPTSRLPGRTLKNCG